MTEVSRTHSTRKRDNVTDNKCKQAIETRKKEEEIRETAERMPKLGQGRGVSGNLLDKYLLV